MEHWGVVIAIAGQITTWLGIIILFSIAWGKMCVRMENVESKVKGIDVEMHNPDHKLLTEDKHLEICDTKQKLVFMKLEHICRKLDERCSIDSDLSQRVRNIETSVTEIKTELKIRREA